MESGSWGELDELKPRPPQTPPKEGLANTHGPMIEKFLFVWNRTKVELEDIKFGFEQKHRPSPNGEG